MQYGYKVNVLTETSTTHIDSSLTRERTTQHGVPADICGSNHEFQRETEGDSVKNQVKIPRVSCCRRRATINTWGTDFANAGAQEAWWARKAMVSQVWFFVANYIVVHLAIQLLFSWYQLARKISLCRQSTKYPLQSSSVNHLHKGTPREWV